MPLVMPEKVKCGACSFMLQTEWKETKWCGDCKAFCCSRCRGGIKSNKCPKCTKLTLKPGHVGANAVAAAKKQSKVWQPTPGGENI